MVFNWPGIGQLLIASISQRDYAVVQAAILVIALFFVVVNFGVDLLYGVLDPRVRLR
nr:ABC transporter permease subunit [Subtercola boreus]